MPPSTPIWKDKHLVTAIVLGTILRVLPLVTWLNWHCARDECTYLRLARKISNGEGMVQSAGWLWAPGYPMLMAVHKWLTGFGSTIKGTQIVAAAGCTILVYLLSQRVWRDWGEEESLRVGRVAAWMYSLSPLMIFFSISMWSEVIYGTLLLGLLYVLDRTRAAVVEAGPGWWKGALLVGVMGGCCVLFRGVATYMLPIFAVSLLWRRLFNRRAWIQVTLLMVAAVLTVAPYSVYISKKHDAFIISDRTLGQMMWLGNNNFPPITFDYGNGQLSQRSFKRYLKEGRGRCASRKAAMKRDSCETKAGFEWIKDNPEEFAQRMPLRVAQMFNPHSLMTRHLRWGGWRGLPQAVDELLILWQATWSLAVMLLGTVALLARGRGGYGVVTGGILLYHMAAISALAGLTRYRVPLEPLLMIYGAGLLSRPGAVWRLFKHEKWRAWLAVPVLAVVIPLVLWFLPVGWTWWRSW